MTSLVQTVPSVPTRRFSADTILVLVLLALLAAAPLLGLIGAAFWTDVLTRVMINAIAAASLNLIVGQGGLVSLGHAAYFGIGGYAVGIAAANGIDNGFIHLLLALGLSAAFALLSGLLVLRTRGVHFIMVTLAFGQMLYFVVIGLKEYGGDDGLTIDSRSVFPILNFENRLAFYYVTFALLALTLLLLTRIRASRFGLVLAAAKGSERRVQSTGFDPLRYRLVAFVIAGMLCALAGFLNANFTNFVTPDMMSWTRSAGFLFMVILGGSATIAGPLVGAAVFLLIEEALGSLTVYWEFWFGLALILVVLFVRGGLVGFFVHRPRA